MRHGVRMGVLVAVPLCLVLVGCSTEKPVVRVSGKLLKNGKPLQVQLAGLPPGDPGLRVDFLRLGEGDKIVDTFNAVVNVTDGSFTVPGERGSGVAAGKYRVTVEQGAVGTPDKLGGAFREARTPFTVELPAQGTIVLDVGTMKVTTE